MTLRPIADADLEPLVEIIREPSVPRWWWEADEPELPAREPADGAAAPARSRGHGELAGWLGYAEETEPGYRPASLDISLTWRFQGQGLGPDALRTAIRWFASERGHHRFRIDPYAWNEPAIRGDEAVGLGGSG